MAIGNEVLSKAAERVPPQAWFGVSALFHYLGPSFAVLLFPAVGVLGVAWLRIASAALIFAPWTKPWRTWRRADGRTRWLLVGLGVCLAVMNCAFYLALDRLPMSLVAAIEFVGTIAVALYGLRTGRNLLALVLAVGGVFILIDVTWASDPLGLFWAFLNGALFVGYILLGHRAAQDGAGGGVERLGAAMAIAFLFVMPIGIAEALRTLTVPELLLAGIGVGICSSVIPYICDQLAMSRLLCPSTCIATRDGNDCRRRGAGADSHTTRSHRRRFGDDRGRLAQTGFGPAGQLANDRVRAICGIGEPNAGVGQKVLGKRIGRKPVPGAALVRAPQITCRHATSKKRRHEMNAATVGVGHDLKGWLGVQRDKPLDANHKSRLLQDLPMQRRGERLARFDVAADRRPAITDAPAMQKGLAGRIIDDRRNTRPYLKLRHPAILSGSAADD